MASGMATEAPIVRLTFEDQDERRTLPMLGSRLLIGRGKSCQLRLASPFVSRFHAAIELTDDYVLLRDLASSNGTSLNGKKVVAPVSLVDGDTIAIGPVTVVVSILWADGRRRDMIAEWHAAHPGAFQPPEATDEEGTDDGPDTWPAVDADRPS